MSGHLRPLYPQREHLWGKVPSNVTTSVQENIGTTSIPNVHKKVAPNRPVKMVWIWVPKKKDEEGRRGGGGINQ